MLNISSLITRIFFRNFEKKISNIQVNKDEKLEKSKIILIKCDFLGMAKDLRGR